jgi:hypothetical protein
VGKSCGGEMSDFPFAIFRMSFVIAPGSGWAITIEK